MTGRRIRWIATALAAAMLAGGLGSLRHVSARNSPVWDELHLWGIGYYVWTTGRFDTPGVLFHPPLSSYLNSLPLFGKDVPLEIVGPPVPEDVLATSGGVNTSRGNLLIERLGYESFLAARLPFIALYGVLGLLVFLWARRWWGDAGGLFALALCLLCPNLMANGFLLTTDFLVTLLLFAALCLLAWTLERPAAAPLLLFLGAFALAPAAKLTGLLVGPLCALAVLAHALGHRRPPVWVPFAGIRRISRPGYFLYWAALGVVATAAAYVALVVLYQGDFRLRTYRLAIGVIQSYVGEGFPMFLDGRISRHGFATYYLKAIPYKTATPVLMAWALSALVARGVPRRGWLWAAGAGAVVVAYFSLAGYTLGLRYPLVFFPLMAVASGRLAAPRPGGAAPSPARLALCAALLLAALADLVRVYPYPRSYVNRLLVRRPAFAALADVDLDWGEGLIALRDHIEAKRLPAVALSYHGSAWPDLFGIPYTWLESTGLPGQRLGQRPGSGLLFVSSTMLSGVYFRTDPYAWLRPYPPVDVVGGTIYVYDLDRIHDAAKADWMRLP